MKPFAFFVAFLVFFFSFIGSSFAQKEYDHFLRDPSAIRGFEKGQGYLVKDPANNAEIEGSPYLWSKMFWPAVVFMRNKKVVVDINMRYNVSSDQMEYTRGDTLYAIDGRLVDSMLINNQKFIYIRHEDVPTCQGFYQVVGKQHLNMALLHYKTRTEAPNHNVALNVGSHNVRLFVDTKKCILFNGKMMPLNSRSDLNAFFDRATVKKEELGYKSTADLLKVFKLWTEKHL